MAMGEGRFMAVSVKTGLAAGGLTEIVEGLDAGDPVVVSGQFLIDSESNLKESLGKLATGHAGHGTGGAAENPDGKDMRSETKPHQDEHDDDGSRL
jgi:Cu(I)/Ag(I) efflux system membrane fusion protein